MCIFGSSNEITHTLSVVSVLSLDDSYYWAWTVLNFCLNESLARTIVLPKIKLHQSLIFHNWSITKKFTGTIFN